MSPITLSWSSITWVNEIAKVDKPEEARDKQTISLSAYCFMKYIFMMS